MIFKKFFTPVFFYHLFLFFTFSISMNNSFSMLYINIFFYVLFHILIIYLAFYYFHYLLYFVYLFYGIFIDYLLLNQIGPHLIVFIFLIFFVSQFQKILINVRSNRILFLIIGTMYLMFLTEMILTELIANYNFDYIRLIHLFIIGTLIIYPIIILFSKIEKF